MGGMREVQVKSPLSFYLAAAVYALYALIFPMYRIRDFLLALMLTAAAFALGEKLIPKKTVLVPEPPVLTGDEAADRLLASARADVERIEAARARLTGEKMIALTDAIRSRARSILEHIERNAGKASQVRRFCTYYLPTTAKLITTYADLEGGKFAGENIGRTKENIKDILEDIAAAFDRQLDSLYQDVALDISTDITVLEQLLERDQLN